MSFVVNPSSSNPRVACIKILATLVLVFVVMIVGAYLFRVPLLTTFTNLWVIDEGRPPADAVVVLGGGANTRTFAAAQAYKDGLVKWVLIPDVKLEPIEIMGLKQSHTEICKSVVLGEGVPESAIQLFGDQVSSTWEEVNALKRWCDANQATVILTPTELFRSARQSVMSNRRFSEQLSIS